MKRDQYGIIIQEGDDAKDSGGDSAFATGLMAFTGSVNDLLLMPKFIINGKLVRHPYQDRWNKPELTSRDQVIAFFAGIFAFNNKAIEFDEVRKSCLFYAKSWFVNKDILGPGSRLYLYKCAGEKPPIVLYLFACITCPLGLFWDCFIKPDHEMGQSVVKNAVFGKSWLKLLYDYHPDLCGNITEYFSGWRRKNEIGERLNTFIRSNVNADISARLK